MKINLLILILILFQFKSFSQSNNPAPYCMPVVTNIGDPCNKPGPSNQPGNYINDFIDGFYTTGGLSNITNTASGCCGMPSCYIYYCQQYLQANAGTTVTCYVKSGAIFAMGFAMFIDWNQDNTFSVPAEQVGATPVPTAGTWTSFTFAIPAGQANGTYRLRLRGDWATPGSSITPCGTQSYGETEDYNVYVGISPPPPAGIIATATSNSSLCAGQTLSLTANVTGTAVPTYSWTGPMSYTSNLQNPVLPNTTFSMGGTYWLAVTTGSCPVMASTYAWIQPAPAMSVSTTTNPLCSGSSATLTASGANTYSWSTGSNTVTTVVAPGVTTIYTLTGSNGTCTATMAFTQSVIVCSGINEFNLSQNGISVYPNPFKNELFVKVNEPAEIKLYNSIGQLIIQRNIKSEETINVEELNRGIFYLSYQSNGIRKVVKLVKD